ncbi:MAG: SusC/RagA family TonB-linked outer membrane protein [Mangrovibacterium sp.]
MKKKFCIGKQSFQTRLQCLILFLFLFGQLHAQQKDLLVSGTVSDHQRQPLPGVTVVEEGTTNGTITDNEGNFIINVSENSTLVFSFVGMKSQKIDVNSRTKIDVVLEEETIGIEEVVAIGYGTQKRSHFAGASSGVNAEKERISEIPVESIDKALQGRLAGVSIRDTEGQVGLSPEIRIRGNASFSASNSPLIVVDGLPLVGGSLNDVNMSDVASVEVLKDAASSAIYGSRGANGVIMITTKQGEQGKNQFNFSMYLGVSNVLKYYDTYKDYKEYAYKEWYEAYRVPWETSFLKDGLEVPDDPENYSTYLPFELYFSNQLSSSGKVYNINGAGYYNLHRLNEITNAPTPQESITNNNAKNMNISLSARGGNSRITYYISGNYKSIEGVMIKNDMELFSLKSNIKAKLNDKLSVEFNINPIYQNSNISSKTQLGGALRWLTHPLYHDEYSLMTCRRTDNGGAVPLWVEPGDYAKSRDFRRMYLMNDDFSDYIYDSKGNKIAVETYSGTGAITSHTQALESIDNREYYKVTGNLAFDWNIIKDLVFRTSLGIYFRYSSTDGWIGSFYESAGQFNSGYGVASYSNSILRNVVNENTLSYQKKFGKHHLTFLAGFSSESYLDESIEAEGQYFSSGIVKTLDYAGEIVPSGVDNGKSKETLVSVFGRVNYNYKDRYLLSLVARADGSSQFGADSRWGNFPSVSAAWRVSEEDFMKNVDFINDMKLRASYGISGNNRISRYSYVTGVNSVQYVLGNELVTGYAANSSTLGNSRIGWEQLNAANLGISVSMLNNRVAFNIDTYLNRTKSLLLRNPIVNITGHEYEWANIGQIESKGVEVEINTVNIQESKFQWSTNFNISYNKNKLLDYGGAEEQFFAGYKNSVYRMKVGRPLGEFYGYKTTGEIWKTKEELVEAVANEMAFASTTVGEPKYVDTNRDGKITLEDKTNIGDPYPDFEWGLTNQFLYKNFDLGFTFQGSHGSEVWNLSSMLGGEYLKWLNKDAYLDAYHGNSPDPDRADALSENDFYVEDASYVALRDVSLGYKLPIPKIKVRIYFEGRNLLYFMSSGYNGLNPEYKARISGDLISGEQRYNVAPLIRTYTFGLDVKF